MSFIRKTTGPILGVIILALGLWAVSFWYQARSATNGSEQVNDQAAVTALVENWGKTLKNVSLLSSTASTDLAQTYKYYVAPDLLAKWQADPTLAVGRLTSSPWPDSIQVTNVQQLAADAYEVDGQILEFTSSGQAGATGIRTLVIKSGDKWLVSDVLLEPKDTTAEWPTASDTRQGIDFKYPKDLGTKYVATQDWPPVAKVESGKYSCAPSPLTSSVTPRVMERVIGSQTYCITISDEGAAGSVYSTYTYKTVMDSKTVSLTFTLRYPSCGNYASAENTACTDERETFDLDNVADQMVQTIQFTK